MIGTVAYGIDDSGKVTPRKLQVGSHPQLALKMCRVHTGAQDPEEPGKGLRCDKTLTGVLLWFSLSLSIIKKQQQQ